MGSAPTFNIEVLDATEEQAVTTILPLIREFTLEYPEYSFERDDPEKANATITVPNAIDTEDTSFTDSFTVQYMEERHNEYVGNDSSGVIVTYQTYYGEDMQTLFPKLEFLNDLHSYLQTVLEHHDVTYRATASTI